MFRLRAIFMLLITAVSGVRAHAGLPAHWQSEEAFGADRMWVNRDRPSEIITLVTASSGTPYSFKGATREQIAAGLAGVRQHTLTQLGYRDWKLTRFGHEHVDGADYVLMAGSYVRLDGVRVHFLEYQRYSGQRFRQVSWMSSQTPRPRDQAELRKSLLAVLEESERAPASDEETEAAPPCPSCGNQPNLDKLATQARQVSETAQAQCPAKPGETFINPEMHSILQDLGFDGKPDNFAVAAGRSALTCAYGILAGGTNSVKGLVQLVAAIDRATQPEALSKFFSLQNLKGAAVRAASWSAEKITLTGQSVASAWREATDVAKRSYQEGGVTGSLAALAQTAYEKSPHHAIGRALVQMGEAVGTAMAQEWGAFRCLDVETASQLVCEVVGFIGAEIIQGRILLSALSKSPKFLEAVSTVKARFLARQPSGVKAAAASETAAASQAAATSAPVEAVKSGAADTGVRLSEGGASQVAQSVASPDRLQQYQDILYETAELRKRAASVPAGTAERATLDNAAVLSRSTAESVTDILASESGPGLNLKLIHDTLVAAEHDPEKLKLLNDALGKLKKALDQSTGKTEQALKSWQEQILKDKPHLTEKEVERAGKCLMAGAAR